jgi:hypothetical protein
MENLKRIFVVMSVSALTSTLLMLAVLILLRAVNPFGDVQELKLENILVLAFLSVLSAFFGAVIGLVIAGFKLRLLTGTIIGIFIKSLLGASIFLLLVSSSEHRDVNSRYLFPLALAALYAFYGGAAGFAGAYVNRRFLSAK